MASHLNNDLLQKMSLSAIKTQTQENSTDQQTQKTANGSMQHAAL